MAPDSLPTLTVRAAGTAKRTLQAEVLAAVKRFEQETGMHVRGFTLSARSAIDRFAPETVFVEAEVQL